MKIAVLVFKALHSKTPKYLSDELKIYIPRRSLRSSDDTSIRLELGSARTRMGRGEWRVVGPSIWNKLPEELRAKDLKENSFKTLLSNFHRALMY